MDKVTPFAILFLLTFLSVANPSKVSSEPSPRHYESLVLDEEQLGEFHSRNTNVGGDVAENESSASDTFLMIDGGSKVPTSAQAENSTEVREEDRLTEKKFDEILSNWTEIPKSQTRNVSESVEHDGKADSEDNLGINSFSNDFGTDRLEDTFELKEEAMVPLEHSDRHETDIVIITTESVFPNELNKNVQPDTISNNESTHDSNPILDSKSPPVAINELEENEKASVLDLHPVLSGNRTIKFRAGEPSEWHLYVDNLTSFLEPFTKESQDQNVHCDYERVLSENLACRFDLVYLGPSCTKENNFGYAIGKPCVIISPAKVANWVPTAFDNESIGVPDEVQRLMRIFNSNFLFVTCEGEGESDRMNIGPMAYLPPYQGFPSYFFPYKGDSIPDYVPPLMAVEFLNPTNGTLINVLCRAWARNLPDVPRRATLRFSLQVN